MSAVCATRVMFLRKTIGCSKQRMAGWLGMTWQDYNAFELGRNIAPELMEKMRVFMSKTTLEDAWNYHFEGKR